VRVRPRPTPRPLRRRRALRSALALAALLHGGVASAAAFLPGQAEPDPPTGDVRPADPAPDNPIAAGNGIRWQFAPWRWRGNLALDARWLTVGDGRHQQQWVSSGDVEFASYLWQPWFVQVRAGVGLLAARGSSAGGDAAATRDSGFDLTGRLHVSVFPASRFPFELRADLGDSRANGDNLGTDYRSLRLALSQSYQPARSSDQYTLNLDHSRLTGNNGIGDALTVLRASSSHLWTGQSLQTAFAYSNNTRRDSDDATRNLSLSAQHSWTPDSALAAETLASWNDTRLRLAGSGAAASIGAALLQLSTVATWRPRPGDWLYSETAPVTLAGTVRVSEASSRSDVQLGKARAFSLAAGAAKDLSRTWRINGGFTYSRFDGGGGAAARAIDISGANGALSFTPEGVMLGEWRYAPTASLNLALNDAPDGQRRTVGLQGSHSVSRSWPLTELQSISFSLAQSLGALRETPLNLTSTGLSHSVGLFWQHNGEGGSQTFASVSVADSRNRAQVSGTYQFVNLQLSQRSQLSRFASWSANLTVQTSRSDAEQLDPFTGERRRLDDGWQRYYSGTVSCESARVFGVPRLRLTALLMVNSQQYISRAAGDIEAPLERTTQSFETRLDYTVGRLDLRLSARAARIEGRQVAGIAARVQRRF
jgi:hypothetical protein